MIPPLTNATITKVAGSGAGEDYDQPAGPDIERWAGSSPAYVTEKVISQITQQGRLDEIKSTRMVVPLDVGKLAKRGDTITFNYGGSTNIERTVRDIQQYQLFGTARLWFIDA